MPGSMQPTPATITACVGAPASGMAGPQPISHCRNQGMLQPCTKSSTHQNANHRDAVPVELHIELHMAPVSPLTIAVKSNGGILSQIQTWALWIVTCVKQQVQYDLLIALMCEYYTGSADGVTWCVVFHDVVIATVRQDGQTRGGGHASSWWR